MCNTHTEDKANNTCTHEHHNHAAEDKRSQGHDCCCHNHGTDCKLLYKIAASILILAAFSIFKPQNLVSNPEIQSTITFLAFFAAYLIVSLDIIKDAVKNIFKKKLLDENFLMTAATLGAFAIGEYPEAFMVMVLYQIGEFFNHYAVGKSKKSIADLMKIKPDCANVERGGKIFSVSPNDVKIGEITVVKPGEKIPLDGVVVEGFASVDTSNLTGESLPRDLKEGDEAVSGCINLDGVIKIQTKKEFGDSTVSKILDLIQNAGSKKAKTEKFITKFAKYYTPFVVIMAVLLVVIPLFFDGTNIKMWFERALTFLVISCPCALVISIPLGFFGGIGAASRRGILIKGSDYLETLSRLKTIVFDKTGTLTTGKFHISKIEPHNISKEELLKYCAHAEYFSSHPVALCIKESYFELLNAANGAANNTINAVVAGVQAGAAAIENLSSLTGSSVISAANTHTDTHAGAPAIDPSVISNLKQYRGLGISAEISGKNVLVGNLALMKKFNIKHPDAAHEGGAVIYAALDGVFAGHLVIQDTLKENAKDTLTKLKTQGGIEKIVMLTGDSKEAALKIKDALPIDEAHWALLPDGKTEIMEKLLSTKSSSAFVGDGINDAPVLSRADIGIAMGKLGSDAAIESSDVVITDDNLSKINDAILISKKTIRIIKQNIVFILAVKFVFLALGAFGLVTMWGAVFADTGVSILAVLNSLRLLFIKFKS